MQKIELEIRKELKEKGIELIESPLQKVKKEELKIFLKDILEEEVDEKYYLSEEQVKRLIKRERSFNERFQGKNVCGALCARDYKDPKCIPIQEAKVYGVNSTPPIDKSRNSYTQYDFGNHSQQDRVFNTESISLTLSAGNSDIKIKDPFIIIKTNTKKGYDEAMPGDGIRLEQPNSKTARGRVIKKISGTVMCNDGRGVLTEEFRIRKLTPKECFRLMGFLNDEINLEGLSNTQRYKLAGNGWDINLVSKIFKEMFNGN